MAGAQAFLEGWRRLIQRLGPGDILVRVPADDDEGQLFGHVQLPEGVSLHVYLRLKAFSRLHLARYSIQLLDADDNTILRFDNSLHHLELAGAPHHLHLRGQVLPVIPEPSLRYMLAAVREAWAGRPGP